MKFFKGLKPKQSENVKKMAASGFLQGNFLVSTTLIQEDCFRHTVVFIANHDKSGAMGLIVNKQLKNAPTAEILKGLSIESDIEKGVDLPLYFGGPVENTRGFVIHSDEYKVNNTVSYPNGISITSEKQAVEDFIQGKGAKDMSLILGYSGWTPGQLEKEIESGAWITVPASKEIIFGTDNDSKWQKAAEDEGIDIFKLTPFIGNA